MNSNFIIVTVVLCVLQIVLPARFAFIPLLFCSTALSRIEILPELSPARIIIIIGLARAQILGLSPFSKLTKVDISILALGGFLILSSVGHEASAWVKSPLFFRVGLAINYIGTYFYGKAYLKEPNLTYKYAIALVLALVPLGMGMYHQARTGFNPFSIIGATSNYTLSRLGELRAAGPYTHAILAGCVGATAIPFAAILWQKKKYIMLTALLTAAFSIVVASNSSGPQAVAAASIGLLFLSRFREWVPKLIAAGIFLGFVYGAIKGRPPWFIMAGMDLTGGSTGWHRAELISQSLSHIGEWWLFGSDYTRHWMSSGMRATPNHSDLTNYFIYLGVFGGLTCTLLLAYALFATLRALYNNSVSPLRTEAYGAFDANWTFFSAIALHAIAFVSIAYFDQSFIMFYIVLGGAQNLTVIDGPNLQNEK